MDALEGQPHRVWIDWYQELFQIKPDFAWDEPQEKGPKLRCRVTNVPGNAGNVPWGEWRNKKKTAEIAALQEVKSFVLVDAAAAPSQLIGSSVSYAATDPVPTAVIPESSTAAAHVPGNLHETTRTSSKSSNDLCLRDLESLPVAGAELLYCKNQTGEVLAEVLDVVDAFEQAPSARGALHVLEVRRADVPQDLKQSWDTEKRKLQDRNRNPNMKKTSWQDQEPGKDGIDTDMDATIAACLRREREEVAWQLLSVSQKHHGGARSCRVYHGCPDWNVVQSICRTGFAANLAKTKGWFGEGLYSTLNAPYALRYSLGMSDFWEKPGAEGWVIAAKLVYLQVYPVTVADDSTPLTSDPGLKGRRIGAADGARGCDCQFVCVRGHPPNQKHKNRHYLACKPGERPEATEIVVDQETRILPEYR